MMNIVKFEEFFFDNVARRWCDITYSDNCLSRRVFHVLIFTPYFLQFTLYTEYSRNFVYHNLR